MGEHTMQPPADIQSRFSSSEKPSACPSGQDTSFQHPTPMPYRFTEESLTAQADTDAAMRSPRKADPPNYQTTASEVGKHSVQGTDLHMRWYGRAGAFTNSWVAPSSTIVNASLNTAMDRSNVHPTHDQGWSGHLGLTDFNVSNLHSTRVAAHH